MSTSALGTQFWVDADKTRGTINVNLVEGRVVVETIEKVSMKKFI
ncbi:hypothetical protein [Niabella ginsengisoli]|uniref:Uncharacterized protein n=1 Tax=Niabella ginsengisoli TaxID=522298 RepID=A0ABS9SN02_9BACT|nr:hypothetical protein [Niabella ginsengisoli]MCH5599646.1 hypothetical protein [Niabella ginsengisoli]